MTPAFKYLLMLVKHKYFVFLAGLRTKANLWDLLIHDWTKLLPSELPHYGRQFFGKADDPEGFIRCWIHHQNSNKHHWEYWVPRTGHSRCSPPYPDYQPVIMPLRYVREMVADWLGAGRAYEGKWPNVYDWTWFKTNVEKMNLHSLTHMHVLDIISYLQSRESK